MDEASCSQESESAPLLLRDLLRAMQPQAEAVGVEVEDWLKECGPCGAADAARGELAEGSICDCVLLIPAWLTEARLPRKHGSQHTLGSRLIIVELDCPMLPALLKPREFSVFDDI
jgi:hypothetical protein